jgi:hypothetical protein
LLNRLAEEEFRAALQKASSRAFDTVVYRLQRLACDAVERLACEMNSPKPSRERISAADKVLTQALRFVDNLELRKRVDALEAMLKTRQGG